MLKSIVPFLIIYINNVICDNSSELLSVIVIYRHGDRTPVKPYPTDPYRNASYWPVGFGQLTNRGKLRQLELGQWLRNRYDGFLPDRYSEKDIYIRSTDVDRTLMSAEANLAGLYPPKTDQIWDPDLQWQPIPIHTTPELQDPILAMKKPCAKYTVLLDALFQSPFFLNITKHNHDLYTYLTHFSGTLISNLETLEYLYNTLYIESDNNLTLPAWTNSVFPGKMKPWAALSFATATYTPKLARLKTGPLFYEIIEHLKNATRRHYRKFRVYSGHDMTIANVLNSLGAFQYHNPPYASMIIFELRRSVNSDLFINVFYKNSTELQKIQVKGCDFNCKLGDFIGLLKPIALSVEEWHGECQVHWWEFMQVWQFVVFLILVLSLFVALLVAVLSIKRCKESRKDGVTTYMQLPNDEIA